jgi:hypothetical protein
MKTELVGASSFQLLGLFNWDERTNLKKTVLESILLSLTIGETSFPRK